MTAIVMRANRRVFMTGILASAALTLPACKATADFVVTAVVRRLMQKSSEKAIKTMLAPDGAWDKEIRTAGLKEGAGVPAFLAARELTSPEVKEKVEHAFIDVAKGATDVAAPVIADAIRKIGIKNAAKIAQGGPEAATQALRAHLENGIATSVVGKVVNAMRSQKAARLQEILQGVDEDQLKTAGTQIAARIEEVFWREMGTAEAEIRANPETAGDKELTKLLTE